MNMGLSKLKKEERKIQGICLSCPEPSVDGSTKCEKHKEANRVAAKRHRDEQKIQSLCYHCSEPSVNGGRCLVHSKRHKQYYKNSKAKGLCVTCGTPCDDKAHCQTCLIKQKERKKDLKARGRCLNHPNREAREGKTACKQCSWMVWDSTLRTKYHFTPEEYAWLEYHQDRRCASCRDKPEGGLVLDHDHTTNEIRSLLCGPCNRLIGHAKESISRLFACIDYLKKFSVG